jgi:hypothetical protein
MLDHRSNTLERLSKYRFMRLIEEVYWIAAYAID